MPEYFVFNKNPKNINELMISIFSDYESLTKKIMEVGNFINIIQNKEMLKFNNNVI